MELIFIRIVVLVFSIVFHEVSHGWAAWKLGDPTARDAGRLTMNPLPHIDPMGSILLPLLLAVTGSPFMFGWAKPVPVRVGYLNDPENDHPKVAAAGPASNLLLALISALALGLVALVANSVLSPEVLARQEANSPLYFLVTLFKTAILLNVVLAVFNLIPLPPLDGSWIVSRFLPYRYRLRYENLRRFGFLLVIGFLMLVQYTFMGKLFMGLIFSIYGFFLGLANNVAGFLG
jgi:Zn-dependent protease